MTAPLWFRITIGLKEIFMTLLRTVVIGFVSTCFPERHAFRFAEWLQRLSRFDPDDAISAVDLMNSFVSWGQVKWAIVRTWNEMTKGYVIKGSLVPNVRLLRVKDRTEAVPCRILDFMKAGRPLVINFGSCT